MSTTSSGPVPTPRSSSSPEPRAGTEEIPAGGTCTAEVVFTPTGAGPREASVTVDVREVSTDPVVELSGSSLGPDQASPSAVPTELSFGEQPLNTAGERRQVSIGGPPGGPVVLGTAAVEGLDGDFVIEGDGCSGTQLVPGGACTVGVRFAPGAKGPRQALLTVPRLDGMPPVAVPLSGTGAAPARNAAFDVQPRSVAFREQPVSSPSRPQQVVLTNSGDVPLDVSPVSVVGAPDFAVGEAACPATLEAGRGLRCHGGLHSRDDRRPASAASLRRGQRTDSSAERRRYGARPRCSRHLAACGDVRRATGRRSQSSSRP